jgi:hypothetical protein
VLGLDEFSAERKGIALFHELVEHVIIRGKQAGEFADFEPSFVQRAINGVLFETLREQGGPAGPIREARPLQAADFVVRSLLVDQSRLDSLRVATLGRLEELEATSAR